VREEDGNVLVLFALLLTQVTGNIEPILSTARRVTRSQREASAAIRASSRTIGNCTSVSQSAGSGTSSGLVS
jgi:hypothetical protein